MVVEGPVAGAVTGASYSLARDMFLYVRNKYKYVKKLHKNFKNLNSDVDLLLARKRDIEKVWAANRINMEITYFGEKLFRQIIETEKDIRKLKSKYQNACKYTNEDEIQPVPAEGGQNFESFEVLLMLKEGDDEPNDDDDSSLREDETVLKHLVRCQFFEIAELSKNIFKKTKEVAKLGKLLVTENILRKKDFEIIEMKHGNSVDDGHPLSEKLQKLLTYLEDERLRRAGIWGPPGVGKTTLLKNLNDRLKDHPKLSFDVVIYIDVKADDTSGDIQKKILGRLKRTTLDSGSIEEVGDNISKLLQDSKYLLILNKVHCRIDLHQVGIRSDHMKGKLVSSSINKSVYRSMTVDTLIFLEKLSKVDAWNFFMKIAGDVVEGQQIKGIVEQVLVKLGGLPKLIESVASSLRDERAEDSESLLHDILRIFNSHFESEIEEIEGAKKVYRAYRSIYDELSDDKKRCILYGSLYPQEYEICADHLIDCWIAERFISNVKTYREAQDRGKIILRELTDVCLLEWTPKVGYLKMSVVFRDMGLKLLSSQNNNCKLLVKSGEGINEHLEEEEWKEAKRISLMCTKLQSLPERPQCCKTLTLLLQRNPLLTEIQNSFFALMCKLRVLDLHHTGIKCLPSSISNLTCLGALFLNSCYHLETLPADIVHLKELQILDIRGSGFSSLPRVVGNLVGLKCLRASFDHDGFNRKGRKWVNINDQTCDDFEKIVPPNVIGRLRWLEELSIMVDSKEETWNENADQVAKEAASLKLLTGLCFQFPNDKSVESFTNNSKSALRAFRIIVGSNAKGYPRSLNGSRWLTKRHLIFSAPESISSSVKKLLKEATGFELIGHTSVTSLSEIDVEEMDTLKVCVIEDCQKIRTIVDDTLTKTTAFTSDEEHGKGTAFRLLEQLHMVNLWQLCCISDGQLKPGSFSKLTVLTLNGCPKITVILTPGLAQQVSQLQHLRIENCENVQNIIEAAVARQSGSLGRLRKMELFNLKRLTSICQSDSLDWLSLEEIVIRECKWLRSLSVRVNNANELKAIICEKNWWMAMHQKDGFKERFSDLCTFSDGKSSLAYGAQLIIEDDESTCELLDHHFNSGESSNTEEDLAHEQDFSNANPGTAEIVDLTSFSWWSLPSFKKKKGWKKLK